MTDTQPEAIMIRVPRTGPAVQGVYPESLPSRITASRYLGAREELLRCATLDGLTA